MPVWAWILITACVDLLFWGPIVIRYQRRLKKREAVAKERRMILRSLSVRLSMAADLGTTMGAADLHELSQNIMAEERRQTAADFQEGA